MARKAAAAVLLILVCLALAAAFVSPETYRNFDPSAGNVTPRFVLPGGPGWRYLLGSDADGHSILMWVAFGARLSLFVPFASAALACLIGMLLAWADRVGGIASAILNTASRVLAFLPAFLLLCILLSFGAGTRPWLTVLLFALIASPHQRAPLRGTGAVDRSVEVGRRVAALAGSLVLLQSGVDFLGFGLQPPQVTWGNALRHSVDYMAAGNWWWALFPGAAIAFASVSTSVLGTGSAPAAPGRVSDPGERVCTRE